MTEKPIDPLIAAVVERGIAPLLKRIGKDLGRDLSTDVCIVRDGIKGPTIAVDTAAEERAVAVDGEVRLRIREAYGGQRYVYTAEAVYKRDVSPTGFSGFVAKGEARTTDDGRVDVQAKSWTVRYNVWEFSEV